MADQKIKIMDLTAGTPVDADYIPFIDVSDTTQSPEGTTKRALKSELKGDQGETGPQGIQGIQGETGPQGPAGTDGLDVNWLGEYNGATTYVINDAVSYLGSSYICILESTGNLPTNVTYFDLMAQKGADGDGNVDSVNSQTGVVVLDADDIDDTSTTNKFTTAGDISKLAGIEAGADVTDTTNVTAAGALMDSELTSIADVKALNQSVVSGASPVFATTNMTEGTDKNFVTDAEAIIIGNTSGTNTGDQDLSGKADKTNVLELDNTTAFTPDADYEPATKKYVDDNSGGGGVPINIYESAETTGTNNGIFTFTHSLGLSQTDVDNGKYKVFLSAKIGSNSVILGDTYGGTQYWGGNTTNAYSSTFTLWSSSDPAAAHISNFQANTIKIKLGTSGSTLTFRLIIQQVYT